MRQYAKRRRKTLLIPQFRQRLYDKLAEEKSNHGNCSDWIRENRRRRSAGLPQKRVLPFGMGVYDPIDRTVTKALPGGGYEISHLPGGAS